MPDILENSCGEPSFKEDALNLFQEITEYLWCTSGLPSEFPEKMESGLLEILENALRQISKIK